MKPEEQITIKGDVQFVLRDRDGKIVKQVNKKNLVVTTGKLNTAKLLTGMGGIYPIGGIGCGTGSAAPALSDTTLTGMVSKSLDGYDTPTTNFVNFRWSFDYGEANGITIRELGLLVITGGSPILFSRIVTDPIVKTSALRLEGSWKITF